MIRLGLVGYNEGNGHPYSFSAIINGYDKDKMRKSRFPVIAHYLDARPSSEIGLSGLRVTHIWCPKKEVAEEISKCTFIEYIVDRYEDIANYVDAVIIARDDVESHFEIAKFFLEKGKYVFVDKPLCHKKEELEYFIPFLQKGQLMSCSGLRYKSEMRTSFYGQLKKEDILWVNAISVLDWNKYAIHVLEAVTPIMGSGIKKVHTLHDESNFFAKIDYKDRKYLTIQINKECSWGIKATFFCKDGKTHTVIYNDNFGCFKYMLQEFHRMIETGQSVIDPQETIAVLNAIMEGGNNAYK